MSLLYTTEFGIRVRSFTANLNQAAATYDLATAASDLVVVGACLYMATAAAGLTSVAIQTDTTTNYQILSAADGALVNLTGGKVIATTWTQGQPFYLPSGKKVQYTIVGTSSGGSMVVSLLYMLGAFS